jgi:hypothetical protein
MHIERVDLTLDGAEWSDSSSGRITAKEGDQIVHLIYMNGGLTHFVVHLYFH